METSLKLLISGAIAMVVILIVHSIQLTVLQSQDYYILSKKLESIKTKYNNITDPELRKILFAPNCTNQSGLIKCFEMASEYLRMKGPKTTPAEIHQYYQLLTCEELLEKFIEALENNDSEKYWELRTEVFNCIGEIG